MKSAESWITLVLLGGLLLLFVTHAGGFATDVMAGGKVLDQTVSTMGGVQTNAGVNVPFGTKSLGL